MEVVRVSEEKHLTNRGKDASPDQVMEWRKEADGFNSVNDGKQRRMQGAAQMAEAEDKEINMENGSFENCEYYPGMWRGCRKSRQCRLWSRSQ